MSNSFKIKSSKNIPYFDLYAAEVSFLEATKNQKKFYLSRSNVHFNVKLVLLTLS